MKKTILTIAMLFSTVAFVARAEEVAQVETPTVEMTEVQQPVAPVEEITEEVVPALEELTEDVEVETTEIQDIK